MNIVTPRNKPIHGKSASSPSESTLPHARGRDASWWRGSVIYQIYPRSFADSNGDGIGDLAGITRHLDHVAGLGVDGIWLSPFFTSPMRDYGYDVADYCDVDPIFGTLADFDALAARARALGLKLIIDQVWSHTSDLHPWFSESRASRDNAKADWYVWADPKPDGSPPNNWQSVFTGPAWTWDARRQQYYLHNFLPGQPDLNLHNPEVQDALLAVGRFWLDRGVDGFRLDAINFGMHDRLLRDNPPAPPPVPGDGRRVKRPFDMQRQVHSMSQPEITGFLERIRALTDLYDDRFTVAEVGGPEPLQEMKAFTAGETRLNTAYGFDFLYAPRLPRDLPERALRAWTGAPGEGWPSWAFSNHDAPRCVSRWAAEEHREIAARCYLMLLLTLRGNVFLYQGEELGLPQADVAFEDLKDPEAIANWPETLGRDGARTPLPWSSTGRNAGFSAGKPWLPLDARHVPLAVDIQEADSSSVLQFTRRLLHLRRESPALQRGEIEFIAAPDPICAFIRRLDGEEWMCVLNPGPECVTWSPDDAEEWQVRQCARSGRPDVHSAARPPSVMIPYAAWLGRRK